MSSKLPSNAAITARRTLACFGLLGLLTGCTKMEPPEIVTAEGLVRLEGKPLNKVEVLFCPDLENRSAFIARGVTDEHGHFSLKCNGQDGACAGRSHVVIKEAELPDRLKGENAQAELRRYRAGLGERPPLHYRSVAETPLVVDVSADQGTYTFELTRTPPNP